MNSKLFRLNNITPILESISYIMDKHSNTTTADMKAKFCNVVSIHLSKIEDVMNEEPKNELFISKEKVEKVKKVKKVTKKRTRIAK